MLVIAEKWKTFLETPIVALEDYGLPARITNVLEQRYGLYIKNIQHISLEELNLRGWMGKVNQQELIRALNLYYKECQQ